MRDEVVLVLKAVVVVGGLIAAAFWLSSARVTVPDNQDTFIAALQRIGKLNSIGAAVPVLPPLLRSCSGLWVSEDRVPILRFKGTRSTDHPRLLPVRN